MEIARKELEDTNHEIRKEIIDLKECLTSFINKKIGDIQISFDNMKSEIQNMQRILLTAKNKLMN